ncbi:winged helix-turn-helix domain-containing tetratricopeptide repeat protein [soil metagenome]
MKFESKPGARLAPGAAAQCLRLGPFELDLDQGELRDAGGQLAGLRRQALQVLLLLGQHAGQVVSKDRLLEHVWPEVVVAESSLAQAVADIRRCLGDDGHRLVRTVARRGYTLAHDANMGSTAGPTQSEAPHLTPLPGAASPLSVAVLPFVCEGPDPDLPWLANALQSDLTTEVSRLIGCVVTGVDTSAGAGAQPVDAVTAARTLGVRHVVRGALRHEGSRIRLNLALVDGQNGRQRWADIFFVEQAVATHALGDFAIQVERALQPELYRACAAGLAGTTAHEPPDADTLAVQAFALWYQGFNRSNVMRAIGLLQSAVELDPDAARAWAGIGFMSYTAHCQGWGPGREESQHRAEAAVTHLERLDRDGNYTYQCKAIAMTLSHQWERLIGHTRLWTQRHRHPNAFGAHGAALLANGDFEQALLALQRAVALSPRDPIRADWQHRMAMCHLAAGRFDEACQSSQAAEATNSALGWPPIECAGLMRLGRAQEARVVAMAHSAWRESASIERLDRLLPGRGERWQLARSALIRDLRACAALPDA